MKSKTVIGFLGMVMALGACGDDAASSDPSDGDNAMDAGASSGGGSGDGSSGGTGSQQDGSIPEDPADGSTNTDEDAGVVKSGVSNHIAAKIDGVEYRYNNRMGAPTKLGEAMQLIAYQDNAPTTSWKLSIPATVGTYSCASGGMAGFQHLDQGGLGKNSAAAGGEAECTMEVTSAGPVWAGTFSGAAYHKGMAKTVTEGSFSFDPQTAPGGGATAFPDDYLGVLLTITAPVGLADSYLVKQTVSELDAGKWAFSAQNIQVAPEFRLLIKNLTPASGSQACSDGLSIQLMNNINGAVFWQNGGSCSFELTTFEAGQPVQGTFSAELPSLTGGPDTLKMTGKIRATFPE